MTMTKILPKRPRDPAQLAKLVVDLAVEAADNAVTTTLREVTVNPQSVRGQAGGLKGGAARAKALTAEQRQEIAKKAAGQRWKKRSMSMDR